MVKLFTFQYDRHYKQKNKISPLKVLVIKHNAFEHTAKKVTIYFEAKVQNKFSWNAVSVGLKMMGVLLLVVILLLLASFNRPLSVVKRKR